MDTIVKEHKSEHHHHGHEHPKIRPMASAKTYKVTVVAKPGAGENSVDFSLDSNLKDPMNGHLVFNKSHDDMKKTDYYLIEFDLDDRTGLGLRFDPNPMDAFWVAMGDEINPPPCPATASYSEEIYAISDDPNGRILTVRNNDDSRQFFAYSLNFIDQYANPHNFDPIGQNQNGGSGVRR
jgi:hypothetical protein